MTKGAISAIPPAHEPLPPFHRRDRSRAQGHAGGRRVCPRPPLFFFLRRRPPAGAGGRRRGPPRHSIGETEAALKAMQAAGDLPPDLDFSAITAEPPRDAAHGDIATNAAMVLAKAAKKKPRDIAEPLLARLKANPDVVEGAVAGPGFINLKIADAFWRDRLRECLKAGIGYGDSPMGQGAKVNVEYVSANPTGPLTLGDARGAVVGDALANRLQQAGYAVAK